MAIKKPVKKQAAAKQPTQDEVAGILVEILLEHEDRFDALDALVKTQVGRTDALEERVTSLERDVQLDRNSHLDLVIKLFALSCQMEQLTLGSLLKKWWKSLFAPAPLGDDIEDS